MKKITLGLLTILLMSSLEASHVMAKSSSGGGTPIEPTSTTEVAPTPVETAPAPVEAAPDQTPPSSEGVAPAPAPTDPKPVQDAPKIMAPAPTDAVICSKLATVEERVKCRVEKTEEEFAVELLPENYFPEGCRWGTEEWQEKCKVRYQAIHDLYSLPIGTERMSAIKAELGLPEKLVPSSLACDGENGTATANCTEEYKDKIVHLIVARFYDVEQRAEELNVEGKITDQQLIDFVVKVSKAKVAMYDGKNQPDPFEARKKVIEDLKLEWNTLVGSL